MEYDLLSSVDQGGCSSKLSALELGKILKDLPPMEHENLLVSIETHDDAGIYRIRDDYALILTTDFFPPVCSDPYDFGQIAAANALSDVYAMGGQVLTALNLVMFPPQLPIELLREILIGGQDKVLESGGVIAGGHTIGDDIPKYGLAVTGWVHPDRIVTNTSAKPGDILILTKPIGTGIIIAARKNNLCSEDTYRAALDSMKKLNRKAAEIMIKYHVKCATDITGFGLLGHLLKLLKGSGVSARVNASAVPYLPQVDELIELGCIPGAAFRNQEYVESDCRFEKSIGYNKKMFLLDAQTSGGMLICAPAVHADAILSDLKTSGHEAASAIGEILEDRDKIRIYVRE